MAALQDTSLWDEIDASNNVTPVENPGDKPNGLPQQSWGSSYLSDIVRVGHNTAQDANASLSASRPLHLGAWDPSPRLRLWSMWCHYSCRQQPETRRGQRCRGGEAPRSTPHAGLPWPQRFHSTGSRRAPSYGGNPAAERRVEGRLVAASRAQHEQTG
ncbi:hypothetical protein GWK47_046124 [Chionoecetes opilio]|uniref:Uncharacterized protein n=1 Tax=Chionoecetes opilio TaxID=41210 RepID=A0A8J4Y7L2_CHIOP|nr:hypothetical protein GWK47_046124 [Chionoecetes opilio]